MGRWTCIKRMESSHGTMSCMARTVTRSRNASFRVHAEYKPRGSVSRETKRSMTPSAPPVGIPPPPPPPPPPPMGTYEAGSELKIDISRRGLLGIMIGGTLAWYGALKVGSPIASVDRGKGVALLRTKGGNIVGAAQDDMGRLFLFDGAGNLYYDTGDPSLGIYIVDTSGNMYNEFLEPESSEVKRVAVGNIADITSISVTEIGGVPIEELQKSVRGFKGGRIVGFAKPPDENSLTWENLMPPNAPASVPRGGGAVKPPPMLEDFELDLKPQGRALPGDLDDTEIVRSLRIDR